VYAVAYLLAGALEFAITQRICDSNSTIERLSDDAQVHAARLAEFHAVN
jgi:hypothetical protein